MKKQLTQDQIERKRFWQFFWNIIGLILGLTMVVLGLSYNWGVTLMCGVGITLTNGFTIWLQLRRYRSENSVIHHGTIGGMR